MFFCIVLILKCLVLFMKTSKTLVHSLIAFIDRCMQGSIVLRDAVNACVPDIQAGKAEQIIDKLLAVYKLGLLYISLFQDYWLRKSYDSIALGKRSMLELKSYIQESLDKDAYKCPLCHDLVLQVPSLPTIPYS